MQGICGGASSGLVQPFGPFRSFACVYVHGFLAVLALHSAAPFELALALGDLHYPSGVIAPPTAHDLTAVCATGRLIADAASSAQGTYTGKSRKALAGLKKKSTTNFSVVPPYKVVAKLKSIFLLLSFLKPSTTIAAY